MCQQWMGVLLIIIKISSESFKGSLLYNLCGIAVSALHFPFTVQFHSRLQKLDNNNIKHAGR